MKVLHVELPFPLERLRDQCNAFNPRTLGWSDGLVVHNGDILPSHVDVISDEGDKITSVKLDWERAIVLACLEHPWVLLEERRDALQADAWIQLAAFGEIRYA